MSIKIMYRQGMKKKAIAKELGLSINTVRKHLTSGTAPGYKKRQAASTKLSPFEAYMTQRVHQASPLWLPATVIYQELLDLGYRGKMRQVQYYLSRLKPKFAVKPVIRFETEPGLQLQADWAEFSRKPRLTAFAATLGYSRASYVEFVNNQRLETLLACHEHAFAFFAGVSKTVLYDNMRTVVVQRDAYGQGLHRFQQGLWDFAKHYGFIPKLCRPYRACTKGKIERFIHYLRYSFYQPLMTKLQAQGVALDVRMANDYVLTWLHQVANHRVHGTTGKIPWQQLEQERLFLQPLPSAYQGQVQPLVALKPMPVILPNNLLIGNQQQPISLQHPLTVYEDLIKPGAVL